MREIIKNVRTEGTIQEVTWEIAVYSEEVVEDEVPRFTKADFVGALEKVASVRSSKRAQQ